MLLHTIPSTWMAVGMPRTVETYRRVIGIETEHSRIVGRHDTLCAPTTFSIDTSPEFAQAVSDFFAKHIAGHDPEHPDSPEQQAVRGGKKSAGPTRYNCHSFALALQGESELDERITRLRNTSTPFVGNLALGEHGIVHNSNIDDISHSFVGLGEDVPLSLQVMNDNSNMALLRYDSLVREYSRWQSSSPYILAK